jgi:predicted DNA-binding WGR domain protein
MTAITLRRSDPTRNLHGYYRLDVQLDLFGAWCFIREWGRIGQAGQTRTVLYPTPAEAQAALDKQRRRKERKGYAGAREFRA